MATIPNPTSGYLVPGTDFIAEHAARRSTGADSRYRDPRRRLHYLDGVYPGIRRLLGAVDRNPMRPTFGCLDRQFWHYRTACFPSEMYQEGALPLALVYAHNLPDNRWHGSPRVHELATAALRFSARSCHRDGSCDDYYPFERALGAAVFSLQAAAKAYQLLGLDDPEIVAWLQRRAAWITNAEESGNLTNHHALAALGLWRVAQITGDNTYRDAAAQRVDQILAWQHAEGWFDEYDGADPGYQTVTIDCLAKLRAATGEQRLDEPIDRAVAFARHFLHPDGSYAGEYGSRGTYHFYPHGMELLAAHSPHAADLADGFLHALQHNIHGHFDDDRLFAHRLAGQIEAYLDWSPVRAVHDETSLPIDRSETTLLVSMSKTEGRRLARSGETAESSSASTKNLSGNHGECLPRAGMARIADSFRIGSKKHFPAAGLFVLRDQDRHTVVSTARAGIIKHFCTQQCQTDAGLIVETNDGTVSVSQMHDRGRQVDVHTEPDGRVRITIAGPLHAASFETATPLKQSILHTGMWFVGRWCRTAVRRLLQRRLITGRRPLPIHLTRTIELSPHDPTVHVTDQIRLTNPAVQVRRLAIGTDHQTTYVAATNIYQDSTLEPWTDLTGHIETLNRDRHATIKRTL